MTTIGESVQGGRTVLVLNSGSSSLKFSTFSTDDGVAPGLSGEMAAGSVVEAAEQVFDRVEKMGVLGAIGYRVVHPGAVLVDHQRITEEVLRELDEAGKFAPLHDPEAVAIIRKGLERFPDVPQFTCFDTVFHRSLPAEASTYPIPESYREQGVKRYGFHGLVCESVVEQMRTVEGGLPKRMVIAHLGSGCSVTAVVDGLPVDTTMGLTPTGGVVMGTRPGDLDPDLVLFLLRESGVEKVETELNHASGMVALSGLANDVKAVRGAARGGEEKALLALKVFTRSVTKAIGGFAWLMGGVDAIVFSGGIGEHDAATRWEILSGVSGLGVGIDEGLNNMGESGLRRISGTGSETAVYVVPAQEELMIATHVSRMMGWL